MKCSVQSCSENLSTRSKRFCDNHLAAYRERCRASIERKRQQGKCVSCSYKAVTGKIRCYDCLIKYANHAASHYEREREVG